MAEHRTAVIDMGSNSFRLVVFTAADGWWKRTDEIYLAVRIGEGLEASGRLGAKPMKRGLEAAEVEHGAVGERRRVDGREVAERRLLLAAEDLDLEAGPLTDRVEEVLLVGGVADRARRDGSDVACADPAGGAEVGEHLGGLEPALHRLAAQLAGGVQALADAHREVDLVRALPPAGGGREHHKPKRVRAQVDDRSPMLCHSSGAQLAAAAVMSCSLEMGLVGPRRRSISPGQPQLRRDDA